MKIEIHNLQRERLLTVEVDDKDPAPVVKIPSSGKEIFLNWDQAFDDRGHLRHCPVCGCRELFVRKDFPQVTGFVIVVLAAVMALILFSFQRVLWALALLGLLALVDGVIYLFTGRCVVCYRCRSEFRNLPISPAMRGWELAVGEKYRDASVDVATVSIEEKPPTQQGDT